MKQLRYLKSAYETSQSLSTLTWPPNTLYSSQIYWLQKKREEKLRSEKRLSTYLPVVEGGQTTSRNLILARYGYPNLTSWTAELQKVTLRSFWPFLVWSTLLLFSAVHLRLVRRHTWTGGAGGDFSTNSGFTHREFRGLDSLLLEKTQTRWILLIWLAHVAKHGTSCFAL